MFRLTRPLAALATAALASATAAQGTDCLSVKAYGQQSNGKDMGVYGKILTLSFRKVSAQLGAVEIGGGNAFATWGLVLGAQRTEYVLPWGDTLLAATPVAFGRGSFDATGKAVVPLQLGGLGAGDIDPQLQLQFFMQAMSLDGDGRPLTSHGLSFELCRASERRGIGDTDENTWTISSERYRTHFLFTQIANGQLGVEGWQVTLSITLPDAGYQLTHDRTIHKDGVTSVLMSIQAPAANGKGGAITRRATVDLGTADPGRVRIHIADLVSGAPAVYKLAALVR